MLQHTATRTIPAAVVVLSAFCAGGSTPDVLARAATVPERARSSPRLKITGDPTSAAGATWTLQGVLDGERVDLQGILLRPRGKGPFPAVVLSHGAGGNAQSYGKRLGTVMRKWGLVAIATNYTHARGVPMGAPGSVIDPGASAANTARAHAAVTVLARLGYVDMRRVAAHGHSMGAFVTTAFVAAHPDEIRVASHTSGGVVLMGPLHLDGVPAPSESQARRIHTPYQWHHGLRDLAVPFFFDRLFDRVVGGVHEGYLYRRLRHSQVAEDPTVLERIKAFYTAQGLFERQGATPTSHTSRRASG